MVRLVEGGQHSPDVDEPSVMKAKGFDLYTTEELDRVAVHPLKNESQVCACSTHLSVYVCVKI